MVEREALEKLCMIIHTEGSNPSLSVDLNNFYLSFRIFLMKRIKIDKTHWIIQFSVLTISLLIFLFLSRIVVDLESIFSKTPSYLSFILPSIILIVAIFPVLFLRKGVKPFSRSWIFDDFIYWNIFSLSLTFIAIFQYLKNDTVYAIITQIFGCIALFLGYANNLRNEIIKEKVKRKK